MANDAKMGLLAGLAAVLMIAVVYYQKSPATANPASTPGWKGKAANHPASVEPESDPILFPAKPTPLAKDVLLRQPEIGG